MDVTDRDNVVIARLRDQRSGWVRRGGCAVYRDEVGNAIGNVEDTFVGLAVGMDGGDLDPTAHDVVSLLAVWDQEIAERKTKAYLAPSATL